MAASRYAREVWEYVNLYSVHRGKNRFVALQVSLGLIAGSRVFAQRGIRVGPLPALDAWLREAESLSSAALARRVAERPDPELARVLAWSDEINARVEDLVRGVLPFPGVRSCLERLRARADIVVVSQTPVAALQREWEEHDIACFADFIAGQEMGSKSAHLRLAAGGRYAPGHILMIGDAPGDATAARENGALFFPVLPGAEEESWEALLAEGLERFFAGRFDGEYQRALLARFAAALPAAPPWKWT